MDANTLLQTYRKKTGSQVTPTPSTGKTTNTKTTSILDSYRKAVATPKATPTVKKVADTKITITKPKTTVKPSLQPQITQTPSASIKQPVQKIVQLPPKANKIDQKQLEEIRGVVQGPKGIFDEIKRSASIVATGFKNVPQQLKVTGGNVLQQLSDLNKKIYPESIVKKLPGGEKYIKAREKQKVEGAKIAKTGVEDMRTIQKEREALGTREGVGGFVDSVLYSTPSMVTSLGIGLVTSLITKNPALGVSLGMGSTYAQTAGDVYKEALDYGADEDTARNVSMQAGIVVSAIESLPLGRLLTKVPGGEIVKKSFAKNVGRELTSMGTQAILEGGTEGLQQVAQNALARTYDENRDLGEGFWESVGVGAFLGAGADISVTALNKAINITQKGKSIEDVTSEIATAIETDPKERTETQQEIVNALEIEQDIKTEKTPQQALAEVIAQGKENTPEGKEIIKSVVQARETGGNLVIEKVKPKNFTPINIEQMKAKPSKAIPQLNKAKNYTTSKDFADAVYSAQPDNQIGVIDPNTIEIRDEIGTGTVEYEQLKADIQKNGIQEPVRIDATTKTPITEDGSQRTAIARELGIKLPVIVNKGTIQGLKTIDEVYKQQTNPPLSPTEKVSDRGVPETKQEKPTVKPQKIEVPREQLPVGEGKEKVSRLEARVQNLVQNIPQETIDRLGLATFNELSKKENIARASEYVTSNPEEAIKVLSGEIEAPKGILRNAIYVAMQNEAIGNVELARKLASITSTRMGQEISILTEIDPNSPVKALREIYTIREERAKKKYKDLKKARKNITENIKKEIKIVDKYDWNAFISSIDTC